MTRFTRLLDIFDDMYDVPTKEEYEELKQSISERFERLESRIAAIEKPLEKNTVTFKRDGEKTMNDVELYTNNLTIMVRLDGYDDKDFDVAIEAGDNRKVITVTAHDVKRLSIDKNLCKIEHILLTYFLLDDIKITCKYPVVVRYNDVVFWKTIEPTKESPKKTFVSDDFKITLDDKGGLIIHFYNWFTRGTNITYKPDSEKSWIIEEPTYNFETQTWETKVRMSQSISDLGLLKYGYETLRKALEVVGKQDLVDNEIVFVDKKEK